MGASRKKVVWPPTGTNTRRLVLLAVMLLSVIVRLLLILQAEMHGTLVTWTHVGFMSVEKGKPFSIYHTVSWGAGEEYRYPPLWGYIVMIVYWVYLAVAPLGVSFSNVVKLPLVLADLGVAVMLYYIVNKKTGNFSASLFSAVIWLFHPLCLQVTTYVGQFDVLSGLFTLASILLLSENQVLWSAVLLGLGISTKQHVFTVPLALTVLLVRTRGWRTAARYLLVAVLVPFLLSAPYLAYDLENFVDAIIYRMPGSGFSFSRTELGPLGILYYWYLWTLHPMEPQIHLILSTDTLLPRFLDFYPFFMYGVFFLPALLCSRFRDLDIGTLNHVLLISQGLFLLFSYQVYSHYAIPELAYICLENGLRGGGWGRIAATLLFLPIHEIVQRSRALFQIPSSILRLVQTTYSTMLVAGFSLASLKTPRVNVE